MRSTSIAAVRRKIATFANGADAAGDGGIAASSTGQREERKVTACRKERRKGDIKNGWEAFSFEEGRLFEFHLETVR